MINSERRERVREQKAAKCVSDVRVRVCVRDRGVSFICEFVHYGCEKVDGRIYTHIVSLHLSKNKLILSLSSPFGVFEYNERRYHSSQGRIHQGSENVCERVYVRVRLCEKDFECTCESDPSGVRRERGEGDRERERENGCKNDRSKLDIDGMRERMNFIVCMCVCECA